VAVIVAHINWAVGLVEKLYKGHQNLVRREKHDKTFFSAGRLIVN
jgi:hypothetical protein